MELIYKNTIIKSSNQIVKKLWEKYELEPGFQMELLVKRLGGSIEENQKSESLIPLQFGDLVYISPTEDGQNFKIICASDCVDGDKIKETFRIRQEVAKELAHLFLHMIKDEGEYFTITSEFRKNIKDNSFYKKEAKIFALILLMPEVPFRLRLERLNLILNNRTEKIKELSEIFKVNEALVLERCKSLGITIW